ncbi:MAG: type IV secretion system protein [Wolbachia endosymbiont of Fragariocoptes setiger]|nr:type IV secretion system protein [Wolbachia endosymbiont of Fragariocoptes setiger]
MFKTKLSLLLAAIFLLNIDVFLLFQAFAEEAYTGSKKSEIISRFNSTDTFNRASNPDCGQFSTGAAVAGIAILVGALWTGIIMLVSSMGILTLFVIAGMITATIGVWKAIGGLVVCQHSFVRHPVMRDDKGKYRAFELSQSGLSHKVKLDKTYKTEDEYFEALGGNSIGQGKKIEKDLFNLDQYEPDNGYYWPKNAVEYSDYIEICNREHLAFNAETLIKDPSEIQKNFDVREKELGNPGKVWLPQVDGNLECKTLKVGEEVDIHGSKFRAVRRGSKLCVELKSVSWLKIKMTPWPSGVDMGCTYLPPDPGAPMCEKSKMKFSYKGDEVTSLEGIDKSRDYKDIIRDFKKEGKIFMGYDNSGCFPDYISQSCYSDAGSKSLTPIPITSMVVQCIKESLDALIVGKGKSEGKTFLSKAQKTLKDTVTAALVLALILFSIKVMSGGVRSPSEMYMLILKFALVMYFTAGNGMATYSRYLVDISNGLSDIVLKASSESQGICNYNIKDYVYTDGVREVRYNYLAPWDKLDCRILFYFGAPLNGVSGALSTGGISVVAAFFGSAPILLTLGSILGIIFAGSQILTALVALFMAIMMMMIILWVSYTFILSYIALNVLIILSPLFVPMVLFQHTKGYFDGWIKEFTTYSVYPVLLFAFLSFMFISCDKIFFKGLTFHQYPIEALAPQKKVWFKLEDNMCKAHTNTLACLLQNYSWENGNVFGLFKFAYIEFENSVLGEILKLSLILFLFYQFLGILPSIVAELAGNPRAALGSGETPKNMIKKAISGAKAAGAALKAASGSSDSKDKDSSDGGGCKSSESLSKSSDS